MSINSMVNGFKNSVAETYNFSNSTAFYSLVDYTLKNYYLQVIKPCQEWLDGYVPGFHDTGKGIVSTRIGAIITKSLVRQVWGRGLFFRNGNGSRDPNALDFISHNWVNKSNFNKKIRQLIAYTLSLGTGLIKLNRKSNGDLWIDTLRADYFYFSCDSFGKLDNLTCFIRCYTSTDKGDNYVLVENRFFEIANKEITCELKGKELTFTIGSRIPKVKYCIYKCPTTSNNNFSGVVGHGETIPFKSLPTEVKSALNKEYSGILIDKEIILPFKDSLGAELVLNEGGDCTHPSLPFGSPLIFDCISNFMEYDLENSFSIRDLTNSRGIVGVPKALSQSQLVGQAGGKIGGGADIYAKDLTYGANELDGYELVPGLDPNTQKPIITQFAIRAHEHEEKQNAILRSIAATLGLSPRVIASYLVTGSYEKTATQVDSEDNTVVEWVKSHRPDYLEPINNIIEQVLSYYGYVGNVEVSFTSDGLLNPEKQLDLIERKLKLNLMDIETAVREINPDLDETQLQEKIKKAIELSKDSEQKDLMKRLRLDNKQVQTLEDQIQSGKSWFEEQKQEKDLQKISN